MGWELLPTKRALGLPLVTTFYGYDMSKLARQEMWQRRYRSLFSEGELFLVEGPRMREALIALGCPSNKVVIQHIAIDVQSYAWQPRKWPDSGRLVLLFCGRFVEKKGLDDALYAVHEAVNKGFNLEFRIIGDGELRQSVKAKVHELDLGKVVRFLGMQPHDQVIREMLGAHVFLHPSKTAASGDSEGGAPTILLEDQAMGLPILSTRHADIPHVTIEGESAFLANEGDKEVLAELLSQLLAEPKRWAPMGKAGREHVMQHHDIYGQVRLLEDRYEALLKRS